MWVLLASIKQNSEFYGNPWTLPKGIYFQNYIEAFKTAEMGEYMLSSAIVTALALVILLVVSLPAAYCLSRFRFFGNGVLNTLFMAGLFINVNYIVVPIFLMLRDADNSLKELFGSGFLLNNLFILALVYASTALPFTIYLLSSYFATLPYDFEEAAYIDGAGYFEAMVKIMLPLAKPAIITVVLFNFLSFWNEYIISMTLLSKAGGTRTLPVGLMNLMQGQQAKAQYGIMYAGLVLVMLPTLILYILVQKKLTEGMTVGGVKG
ncbi:MAG: carbohydrate ABC transporter permease [Clostridia bacterium]|nr:carbohydrate ABC transporter permease [Clostridia bacterium]